MALRLVAQLVKCHLTVHDNNIDDIGTLHLPLNPDLDLEGTIIRVFLLGQGVETAMAVMEQFPKTVAAAGHGSRTATMFRWP